MSDVKNDIAEMTGNVNKTCTAVQNTCAKADIMFEKLNTSTIPLIETTTTSVKDMAESGNKLIEILQYTTVIITVS